MIVKDELQNLKKNLLPLIAVFPEIVIVDTGSNDGTVEWLRSLPQKVNVINFPWTDSFSEARNQYLKASTASWIFSLDADEQMDSKDFVILEQCIKEGPRQAWCHRILENEQSFQVRLFPNLPGVRYVYRCHEQVYQSLDHLGIKRRFFPRSFIAIPPPAPRSRSRNIKLLRMDIAEGPDHLMAYNWLASEYLASGEYVEGFSLIGDVLDRQKKWDTPDEVYIREFALRLTRLLPKAVLEGKDIDQNLWQRLLKNNPYSWAIHHELGTIYRSRGMLDEAILEYETALAIDPGLGDVHYDLGLVYMDKGLVDMAVREFERSLEINAKDAESHMALGLIYSRKGLPDKAISEYQAALAINPNHGGAHNNLAVAYFRKKDFELAALHCDKAVKVGFPVHPEFKKALERRK
jgi:tetratricopeptide (TPR) repeat protein